MGVPITFLHKLNTDQFEIVGLMNGDINCDWPDENFKLDLVNNGIKKGKINWNLAPLLKLEKGHTETKYYVDSKGNEYKGLYARLLIKRK